MVFRIVFLTKAGTFKPQYSYCGFLYLCFFTFVLFETNRNILIAVFYLHSHSRYVIDISNNR